MIKDKTSLLVKLSNKNNFNISVAESCTGGLLSSSIIEQSGASNFFNSGFVTYSNIAKINNLNINKKLIDTYGAVSKETSLAMAKGVYKITKSNLIVSITGVAGPNGGTKINPIGTVYFTFGIKESNKNIIYNTNKMKFNLESRIKIQKKSVNYVLKQFIKIIEFYKFD
jgi:nicotinamide-nucleotide amidase|tara:strand:- start:68 stop:574 length:507 start_codon:yes stop_codon:yes gene_type:complete